MSGPRASCKSARAAPLDGRHKTQSSYIDREAVKAGVQYSLFQFTLEGSYEIRAFLVERLLAGGPPFRGGLGAGPVGGFPPRAGAANHNPPPGGASSPAPPPARRVSPPLALQ